MLATAKLTAEEFHALDADDGRKRELLDGELLEMSTATPRHQKIASRLLTRLEAFLAANRIGDVYPEVEFAISPQIRLRPDLSVCTFAVDLDLTPVPGTPAIAIEVISASELTRASMRKVRAYLAHGSKEVWQFYPENCEVLVHTPGPTIAVLRDSDLLATPVIPGWSVMLSELFP